MKYSMHSIGVIMEKTEKKKRGGRRSNAGRKKTTIKRYGFNAPADVYAVLSKADNITKFISEAVLKLGKEKGLI
ncbi:MAG: hypothetical protein IJY30_01455 [Muribaculaceae bacterium]|nr:hypothetical protein [Muribaculaceae bacterium]